MWLGSKIVITTFQCMVALQSRGMDSNSCLDFMKPGSQSADYNKSFEVEQIDITS